MRSALFVVLLAGSLLAVAPQTPRSCPGAVAAGSFRLRVQPAAGGDALPIRRVNRIAQGSKILYEAQQLPADLKKNGRVALVLVPAVKDGDASGAKIMEPAAAGESKEWIAPFAVSVAALAFAPQGLDEKRLSNLVLKDEELLEELANYASRTAELEQTIEILTSAEEEEPEDALRLTRATPTEQALFTLTRALNPALSYTNPLGGGRVIGPATMTGMATREFFDNAGGLFPGGGGLPMLRTFLMPDTEFRTVYAEAAPNDGLTLCSQRLLRTNRSRLVYLWAHRVVTAEAPALEWSDALTLPLAARSTAIFKNQPASEWALAERLQDWSLVDAGGKATRIPVRLPSRNVAELDLRKAQLAPGEYTLQARWDWTPVKVAGALRLSAIGDLKQVRLTLDSQARLIEGSGLVAVELEGTDFQFIEQIALKRAGRLGAFTTPMEFEFPQGTTKGPQPRLLLELDTQRFRAGDYLLVLRQPAGRLQEVPFKVLPPMPRLTNLPLRVNAGEASQRVILRGLGLDRIDALEADGAQVQLGAGGENEREATVLLASARPGTSLGLRMRWNGLPAGVPVAAALQVTGPRPKISGSAVSLPDEGGVAWREGELPAGLIANFTLKTQNTTLPGSVQLSCTEPDKTVQTVKIRIGERRDEWKVSPLGEGGLFVAVNPGMIGQSGCTLRATLETEAAGASEPVDLGRVVRLPRIEGYTWTDEKSGNGYVAILRGTDLETIEKTGWSADAGLGVLGSPKASAGGAAQQTMRIVLPWPSPSPLAPIYIWLQGEAAGRLVKDVKK
jgi:hypothetical protein